jgi:hypothetical protein
VRFEGEKSWRAGGRREKLRGGGEGGGVEDWQLAKLEGGGDFWKVSKKPYLP